ncbi:MAG: RelA/SpoT family protein [Candidatus Colwellbacteria bacterium]|nr:RelA/SpoT family protein [Candidatus Colwellbacteria bacterium]
MDVKAEAQNNPESLIGKAYSFAENAHKGQRRASGEPYFEHSRKTANNLLEWGLDEESIAAGLLHDVVEDTDITIQEIREKFGPAVGFIVGGVTKLGKIKYRGAESQKENIKNLILASSEDIRVLLVKLSDRFHNMQTLRFLPEEKQKRIAIETYEIYAPLAYRLGMQKLSGELEDLAFPYINPEAYSWLMKDVKVRYDDRVKYLTRIKPIVIKALIDAGIKTSKIEFRAKRYSSLYKKLLRYDMDIEKIHDLVAFRIIVDTVADCYASLGVIHNLWPPLPGRIKDYIAVPKPNGYQSLHTVVIGVGGKPIEFQVRTARMHEEAENGIAAHWAYEEKKGSRDYIARKTSIAKEKEVEWVKRLRNWQAENESENLIDSMKIDFFKDRIFVVTPKGEVIDLPSGSTPIDFAYHIHSAIGDQCVGARVNGEIVPIDHELHSSDVVEVMTQRGKKPSASWLEFVKTAGAKNRIRKSLSGKPGLSFGVKPRRTEFRITAADRVGLIKDISDIISRSHVSIIGINSALDSRGHFHIVKIECGINDPDKVHKLMVKFKSIKEIREIEYKFI